MPKVKVTYRGWPGHFVCSSDCLFRLNTLLEMGKKRIVVSTVGNLVDRNGARQRVGYKRYFETMAFWSDETDKKYHDADVSRQVYFASKSTLGKKAGDNAANKMHINVVEELVKKLQNGEL